MTPVIRIQKPSGFSRTQEKRGHRDEVVGVRSVGIRQLAVGGADKIRHKATQSAQTTSKVQHPKSSPPKISQILPPCRLLQQSILTSHHFEAPPPHEPRAKILAHIAIMSSMRNAVQRRSHRERAQPLERKRFGLLEKDKDRQLRQKDYKKKSATLKSLREKAADRNEDEFYFGMLSRDGPGSRVLDGKKWRGTVAGDRGNRAMEVSLVRLLKTQDIAYVRTTRSVVMREVRRLTEAVVLAAEGLPAGDDEDGEGDEDEFDFAEAPKPKKIVFVDDVAQQLEAVEEEEEVGGADDEDGLDDEDDDGEKEEAVDEETARKRKNLQRLRAELALAQRKLKVLTKAEQELEIQQAKMAKTATSGGTTRKGKKILVRTRKR